MGLCYGFQWAYVKKQTLFLFKRFFISNGLFWLSLTVALLSCELQS